MTAADRAWLTAAACISEDPELFFPVGNTGRAALQIEQAKQVCACCPVRATCLDWAQRLGADEGVWGGLSEHDRIALRRRRWNRRPARSDRYRWTAQSQEESLRRTAQATLSSRSGDSHS